MAARIRKGDTVKIISGHLKGTTAKVEAVLTKQNAALLEGIGTSSRQVKPTRLNPIGGLKDIHTPIPLSKLALVIDPKTAKTSRVGYGKNTTGAKVRLARQLKNKEIQ